MLWNSAAAAVTRTVVSTSIKLSCRGLKLKVPVVLPAGMSTGSSASNWLAWLMSIWTVRPVALTAGMVTVPVSIAPSLAVLLSKDSAN